MMMLSSISCSINRDVYIAGRMSGSRLETEVDVDPPPESDNDHSNNDIPINDGGDPLSFFSNVIRRPKRFLNKACQAWTDRSKTSSPTQQRRMGALNKKHPPRKNRKSKHGSTKSRRRSHEEHTETLALDKDYPTQRPNNHQTKIQTPPTEATVPSRRRFGDDESAFLSSYLDSTNRVWTGCHPSGATKTPSIPRDLHFSNGIDPPSELETPTSTPLVCFKVGRFFGRTLVSSGTLQVHAPVPQRLNEVITPRETEIRPGFRGGASGRFVNSTTRPMSLPTLIPRPPEFQRPLTGVPHSATTAESMNQLFQFSSPQLNPSSPLNFEVLSTEQVVNNGDQRSPQGVHLPGTDQEGSSNQSPHDPPYESAVVEDCIHKISELQIELELMRSEAELERSERQKFQKLYEGSALCQICIENKRNTFILPCSHFVYCDECLKRHWEINEFRLCPLCRGPAHSVIITNLH